MRMTGDILSHIEQTQQQLRVSIEQTKLQSAQSDELIKSCRGAGPELAPGTSGDLSSTQS